MHRTVSLNFERSVYVSRSMSPQTNELIEPRRQFTQDPIRVIFLTQLPKAGHKNNISKNGFFDLENMLTLFLALNEPTLCLFN